MMPAVKDGIREHFDGDNMSVCSDVPRENLIRAVFRCQLDC